MSKQLTLVTNSAMSCYRRCPREYLYSYVQGYRAVQDQEALRIGTLIHAGLELWWKGYALDAVLYEAAQYAIDEYEAAKLRVMLRGYDARWSDDRGNYVVRAVEAEFRSPLRNPETGAPSRTFELGGKIDVLTDRGIVEHKTTSTEIGPGSTYWQRLAMDGQISVYFAGAKALGVEVEQALYDVLRKPAMRPLRATPEEARKYKKDGTLYAAQRERDESPEEYEARLTEEVAADPDRYFQRGTVVRLESELREAAQDTWQTTSCIREAALRNCWPRNPSACERWGRMCSFFGVCTGSASLDDEARFQRLANVNSELTPPPKAAE